MEEALKLAIEDYRGALLEIASTALHLADLPATIEGLWGQPGSDVSNVAALQGQAAHAEALLAAIYVRCGVSWDHLATVQGCSRQSLHRRLSARGERAFEYAAKGKTSLQRQIDREFAMDLDLDIRLDELVRDDEAPGRIARTLMRLRRVRRWWEGAGR